MKWVLTVAGLLSTGYFLYYFWSNIPKGEKIRRFFIPALVFKILAGWTVGMVYYYYYHGYGDTFLFFDSAWNLVPESIRGPAAQDTFRSSETASLNSRTYFFVVLLLVPTLFCGGVYWICSIYMSVISFFASWYLVKTLTSHFEQREVLYASVLAFFFLPSVVFWTSGILKECLTTSAIYVMLGAVININHSKNRERVAHILLCVLSLCVLIGVKYYLAALIVPIIFVYALFPHIQKKQNRWKTFAIIAASVMVMLVVVSSISPNLNLSILPEVVNREYNSKIVESDAHRFVMYPGLDSSWSGLIKNVPKAIFVGLFSPLNFNLKDLLPLLASFQNLMILLLALFSVRKIWRDGYINLSAEVLLIAIYVFAACILLSLTTPNLGTLSRYKAAYIQFFVFINFLILLGRKSCLATNEK